MADQHDMSKETVTEILEKDFGMRRLAVKVNGGIKRQTSHFVHRLCRTTSRIYIFGFVIIGDETWYHKYDPEAKCQSIEFRLKNLPGSKKPQMLKSKIKTMLICFLNIRGIIYFEFVTQGTTVN